MYCSNEICVDRFITHKWDTLGTKGSYMGMVLMHGTNKRSEILDTCGFCNNSLYHRTIRSNYDYMGSFYQEGEYIYVNP